MKACSPKLLSSKKIVAQMMFAISKKIKDLAKSKVQILLHSSVFPLLSYFLREDLVDFALGMFSSGINTAQATTVVHILGFPIAD